MRKLFLIFITCAYSVIISAQGLVAKPDLETNAPNFFDSGKKDKKEPYHFSMQYRLEAGYVQNNHRSENKSYEDLFMHGFRIGPTFDFMLPYRFSIQTGLLYTFTYGKTTQNWGVMSYEDYTTPDPITGLVYNSTITHRLYEHQLTIPIRLYYNVHLWKELNLFFFTGPQLHIGVALKDNLRANISSATKEWFDQIGQQYVPYDRYQEKELYRPTIQWGLGGGLEWERYRLQAGYDFGLNNQIHHKLVSNQQMWEWHWFVSFCYRFNN